MNLKMSRQKYGKSLQKKIYFNRVEKTVAIEEMLNMSFFFFCQNVFKGFLLWGCPRALFCMRERVKTMLLPTMSFCHNCYYFLRNVSRYLTLSHILKHLQQMNFENIVAIEEIAH